MKSRPSNVVLIAFIGFGLLTGCSRTLPTDKSSQLNYACSIINDWPVDYATVWPTAVEKHNVSPDSISAADYMNDYIDAASIAFNINDPEAKDLIGRYKWSWVLLEIDLTNGGGVLPDKPSFIAKTSELLQYCEDNGRGITKN